MHISARDSLAPCGNQWFGSMSARKRKPEFQPQLQIADLSPGIDCRGILGGLEHGDWTFLESPTRGSHQAPHRNRGRTPGLLPQLEKNQEILPSVEMRPFSAAVS